MSNYKIDIENVFPEKEIDKQIIKHLAKIVLTRENIAQAEINIILVDDNSIIKLNQEFLNRNTTTDVLSFNLADDINHHFVEGEVYANIKQIQRQAEDYEVSFREELYRVLIHGLLHLVGYDDQSAKERQIMIEKEDSYLALLKNMI